LLPSGRTAGGFRLFTEAGIARLARIKATQTLLGFSLAEIKETLQADVVRAELRHASPQATDLATRLALIDRAVRLVQFQAGIIDERMARLAKLTGELQERLDGLSVLREQALHDQAASRQTLDYAHAGAEAGGEQ